MLQGMGASYRWRRYGGALILELLIGFGLVTIALLAVFSLIPTGERAASLADVSTQARQLANLLLQDQFARDYHMITVDTLAGEEVVEHTLRRGVEVTTEFHYTIDITKPYSGLEIFNVVVNVRWEQGSGGASRAGSVKLEGEKGRQW